MHRIGCEYLMPAVIIAFPFIKVYSWKKYTALPLWAVYLFLWAVGWGGRGGKVTLGSAPRPDTRKSVCGAGFGERLTANNCSKKAIFLQLGIKTARRARKRGVLGIHKTNYVVKTTEFAGNWRGTLDLEG